MRTEQESMDEWDFSSSTFAWKPRPFLTTDEKQRIGSKFIAMHPARRIDEARLESFFIEYLRFHELKVRFLNSPSGLVSPSQPRVLARATRQRVGLPLKIFY